MKMASNIGSLLVIFIISDMKNIDCHNGHTHTIPSTTAKTFLTTAEKCVDVAYEGWCEVDKTVCMNHNEPVREQACHLSNHCTSGQTCFLTVPCPGHFETGCTNNACYGFPCENGGTCQTVGNDYICECDAKYNETKNCELDCDPGPADVLFLLDASASETELFNKSIDYIRNFVKQVEVGPEGFQFGLMTYASEPVLEFDFDDNTNHQELLDALDNIQPISGATYLATALKKAFTTLVEKTAGVRPTAASKYLIVLTDGLSTDRREAVSLSAQPIGYDLKKMVVGMGKQVAHSEILQIATSPAYVFSPSNDDALKKLSSETLRADCGGCTSLNTTNVLFLLDTSSATQTRQHYYALITVMKNLVDVLDVENTDTRVGLTAFDETIEPKFIFDKYTNADDLKSAIQFTKQSSGASQANVTSALQYVQNAAVFPQPKNDSRNILILFSNGHWEDEDKIRSEIDNLHKKGTSVFVVGVGRDTNIDVMFNVIKYPHHVVYVEDSKDTSVLETFTAQTQYSECDSGIFV